MAGAIGNVIGSNAAPLQLEMFFDPSAVVPSNKLDADQYGAEDLDGVTESLFGSGNMNFLSLQAGQTDDAIRIEGYDIYGDSGTDSGTQPDILDGRGMGVLDSGEGSSVVSDGHYSTSTVGSVVASQLSSDAGGFNSNLDIGTVLGGFGEEAVQDQSSAVVYRSSGGGMNGIGQNGTDGAQGANGQTGSNGINGSDGADGTGTGDVINNVVNNAGDTLGDVIEVAGDIVTNVTEGDIGGTLHVVTNEVNTLTETVNNLLTTNQTVTNVTEAVNTVVGDTVSTVTNVVNNVLGDGGIVLDAGLEVLDTALLNTHLVVEDGLKGTVNTGMVLDTAGDLAQTLTGVSLPLSGVGAAVEFDLLGGAGAVNDGSDISVVGLDVPDVDVALVENIVGDIDVDIALPELPLAPEDLAATVEDTLAELGNIELDPEGLVDALGEEGVLGNVGLEAFGEQLLDQAFETTVNDVLSDDLLGAPLEVVEDAVGDAGIDLESVTDLLGDSVDPLLGAAGDDDALLPEVENAVEQVLDDAADALLPDAGEDSAWTETVGDGVEGLFDDVLDGVGDVADVLPEPDGVVGEGLGILDIGEDLNLGGLGGLFG